MSDKYESVNRLVCSDCGRAYPRPNRNVMRFRGGYWWCKYCAKLMKINGEWILTEFPSKGKMIPKTIIVWE